MTTLQPFEMTLDELLREDRRIADEMENHEVGWPGSHDAYQRFITARKTIRTELERRRAARQS